MFQLEAIYLQQWLYLATYDLTSNHVAIESDVARESLLMIGQNSIYYKLYIVSLIEFILPELQLTEQWPLRRLNHLQRL